MKTQARLWLRKPVSHELTMVRILGVTFHCRCAANVFRLERQSTGLVYVCNSCGEQYEGT